MPTNKGFYAADDCEEFRKKDMIRYKPVKFTDINLYDIEKLVNIWKSGWQNLARLEVVNKDVVIECYGSDPDNLIAQAIWGFKEILQSNAGIYDSMEDFENEITFLYSILLLTTLTRRHCFDNIDKLAWRRKVCQFFDWDKFCDSRKTIAKARKTVLMAIKKTTNSFATSPNYGEALKKLTTKENLDMFRRYWSKRKLGFRLVHYKKFSLDMFCSYSIQPRWQKAFRWLSYGLTNPKACEEAWWNCVWIYMRPIVDNLLKIKENINSDIPLTDEQIQLLNYHMSYGSPLVQFIQDASRKKNPKIIMLQTIGKASYCDSSLEKMSDILLVQPAYALAQEFQNKCKEPRFVIQCRAPSCGKRFYTGRENATACPSKHRGSKSACALEWIRYKRFLKKIGQNPEKDWKKKKFTKSFISYYNS